MAQAILHVSSHVRDVYTSFISDSTLLALPLNIDKNALQALSPIRSKAENDSFQSKLNLLDGVLEPKTPLYILLRRHNGISAITFVPYRAPEDERRQYLFYRHELAKSLGGEHVEISFVCKEVGEVTDTRSWAERDEHRSEDKLEGPIGPCESSLEESEGVKEAGYKKNKCRLCDRRMKNKITDEALEALKRLKTAGDCVQISLTLSLVLALDLQTSSLLPGLVSSHLPTTHPTFTFYRHPNKLLYFIFHSPDSATVQQRMKHTMAIPGLANVHAEDCGVHVDQNIEIHDPGDLVFEAGDERVGRFRSMYLRGSFQGTESQYEGLERDANFYDAVR